MFLDEKAISLPPFPSISRRESNMAGLSRDLILAASFRLSCEKNGAAIDEVLAIWRYLEEAYSAAPPLGTTPKERAPVTIRECPRRKASRP